VNSFTTHIPPYRLDQHHSVYHLYKGGNYNRTANHEKSDAVPFQNDEMDYMELYRPDSHYNVVRVCISHKNNDSHDQTYLLP